ncbi:IS3 family transposase [Hyalangium versicolor]|uniref:IS3 family transposase n=1 Tax=Hyalangium versicolor TaxID=2861190 RepID=UPI001CCC8430|nr:IS3 family transposase [Hyalangium versicolor]
MASGANDRERISPRSPRPRQWTPEEKLRLLGSSLSLTGTELRRLLRDHGLRAEQLRGWREAALQALKEPVPAPGPKRKQEIQVQVLSRDLEQQKTALAESRALLALSWRREGLRLGGRGRFHPSATRRTALALAQEATTAGARLRTTCETMGLSTRTLQRWRKAASLEDGRTQQRRVPANRLSPAEQLTALALAAAEPYHGLPPRQLVARLADQGVYIASESTFYRLRRAHAHPTHLPPRRPMPRLPWVEHVAVSPNQLWSWDITYLKGAVRGEYYFLYLVLDVFSRRIMGWQVSLEESMELASRLILRSCEENGIRPEGLVLHSDNGAPMRGATMLATLRRLGIIPSFSRPRVSTDNPFSEALFRTLKHRPTYPQRAFSSPEAACAWVTRFVAWYNREHLHSGISFVTPDDRYHGREGALLAQRRSVYERAQRNCPARWTRHVRDWAPAGPVRLRAMPPQFAPSLCPRADGANTERQLS